MAQVTVHLPPLHPGQMQVVNELPRFGVLAAGRRWGKTLLGVELCLKTALEGEHAWWVGPDYPTATIAWRMMLDMAAQIPFVQVQRSEMRILSPNGGWVQVKSAESTLRGEWLKRVVIDEAAHIPRLAEIWEQALRPALSDRRGEALFISTPAGYNAFWDLYRYAQSADGWRCWQFPTWSNPYIAAEEIELARQQLPALVFRQEYGAEFVQLSGALFRREWFGILEERPAGRYVRSWDLAVSTKTAADYTVGALVGMAHDGRIVIADIVRGRWEWPQAVRIIAETARSDGPGVIQGIETVGTQLGMLQTLQREPQLAHIAWRPLQVHQDKITRAAPWLSRAEQGLVALVRASWNAAFLDEVCAFPEAEHDDQVDAVSGAMQLLVATPYQWVR